MEGRVEARLPVWSSTAGSVPVVSLILFPDVDLFVRSPWIVAVFVVFRRLHPGRRAAMITAVIFAVAGYINLLVPAIIDEIDRPAAGIVSVAVLVPLFHVARGHAEVDRWMPDFDPVDDDWLFVYQPRRGRVADVNAPIKIRVANTDRYPGSCLACKGNQQGRQDRGHGGKRLHGVLPDYYLMSHYKTISIFSIGGRAASRLVVKRQVR